MIVPLTLKLFPAYCYKVPFIILGHSDVVCDHWLSLPVFWSLVSGQKPTYRNQMQQVDMDNNFKIVLKSVAAWASAIGNENILEIHRSIDVTMVKQGNDSR